VVLGAVGYAVEAGLFFSALRHGTAAAVTLLFFTYPVMVAIVALLGGKGLPGWLLGGALAAATAGAAIVAVAGGGVAVDGLGVLFAMGSALMLTVFLTGTDAVLKATNSLTGAMWVSASAAVGLAGYAAITGTGRIPRGWHQWWPVLGMAVFTAGAFVCLLAGLRRLGVIRTSILSASEPLTAAVLAAVFLGESVRPGTIAGGILILAAAVTASIAPGQAPSEPPVP